MVMWEENEERLAANNTASLYRACPPDEKHLAGRDYFLPFPAGA